jgi:hypothetical protein
MYLDINTASIDRYVPILVSEKIAVSLIGELMQDGTSSFAVSRHQGHLDHTNNVVVLVPPNIAGELIRKYLEGRDAAGELVRDYIEDSWKGPLPVGD